MTYNPYNDPVYVRLRNEGRVVDADKLAKDRQRLADVESQPSVDARFYNAAGRYDDEGGSVVQMLYVPWSKTPFQFMRSAVDREWGAAEGHIWYKAGATFEEALNYLERAVMSETGNVGWDIGGKE